MPTPTTALEPHVLPTKTRSPERAEFLAEIITTAVEGGINYWSGVSDYRWWYPGLEGGTAEHRDGEANAYVTVHEDDGDTYEIGVEKIATALGKIRAGQIKGLAEHLRADIIANDRGNGGPEGDHQDIDASLADIIVQVACLGEVIYG